MPGGGALAAEGIVLGIVFPFCQPLGGGLVLTRFAVQHGLGVCFVPLPVLSQARGVEEPAAVRAHGAVVGKEEEEVVQGGRLEVGVSVELRLGHW